MIKCKEDLYGTYVLNNNTGAIESYLSLINKFGISNNIKEIEQSALALEVCSQGGRWVVLWIMHSLSALDSKSRKLTLSDLKTRTRTEYEKVTESIFDLRDEFERGELYSYYINGKYIKVISEDDLLENYKDENLYRKIEKEIDWRDEVHRCLSGIGYHWTTPIAEVINDDESDYFLELCRVALRANGEID